MRLVVDVEIEEDGDGEVEVVRWQGVNKGWRRKFGQIHLVFSQIPG
jgi:hypothetical protein